ncbi:helix-hairpin-helix domain-containing protein [Streptomyces sp. NPDC051218]|uniref:helix-hairpin-helix domain-containing protein n=1 Tax=Streptomyces sp. NPDC051218 TaxID=3365645 RepID=UPI0037977B3E
MSTEPETAAAKEAEGAPAAEASGAGAAEANGAGAPEAEGAAGTGGSDGAAGADGSDGAAEVGGSDGAAGAEGSDGAAEVGGSDEAAEVGGSGGPDAHAAAAAEANGAGAPEAEGAAGTAGSEGAAGADGSAGPEGAGGSGAAGESKELSETEAEIAAQQELQERIAERKAAKQGPVDAGAKLSGKAADLLAAVRAVESGEKPVASAFSEPGPAPRRTAPEPVRRPQPAVAAASGPGDEAVEAVRAVLADGGAPAALATRTAAALGEGAATQLRDDPWQLLRVGGVRTEQADGFARALLGAECGPDDERRGRAVTAWLLEQAAVAGHTALDAAALTAALGQRAVPDPDAAVQSAIAEGDILVFQDAIETPGAPAPAQEEGDGEGEETEQPVRVLVGLERYALAEESLADGLARVINSLPKDEASGPQAAAWESAAADASGSTAELIRAVAGHGLVLHTGGEAARAEPAALVRVAAGLGLRTWAATHSSAGRRHIARLTGSDEAAPDETGTGEGRPDETGAVTVAGLLSGAEGPGRDSDGALALDLLVVLDAPQLDVETAAMLVESLPDGARLVLSGDPGVLWSAGPGRVFADLLAARCCPQVVSRVPDPGPIGELVSGIGIGELNQVEAPGKEVVIVPVRDAGEAVHRTVQLVADSVPRAIGVPTEDTQVITPGHGGAAGTRALNTALKERLNPGPGRFGGFDPGDRVAHVPAPGRTTLGRVLRADAQGLHLECDGAPVVVPKEQVEQTVRHAWALTAHQAVGLSWPAAVVVLPGDATAALSRPWVYTAFSRGERHLSVVQGAEQALPRAVAEIPAKARTTRLQTLLRPQVPATA